MTQRAKLTDLYDNYHNSKRYHKVLTKWVYRGNLPGLHREMYRRVREGRLCKIFYRVYHNKLEFALIGADI